MILRLLIDSHELQLLRFFDADEVRHDPWNLAPRIIQLSERGNSAVVCLERLFEYDQPPLQTVANVIDFVKQTLEGLAFLHEHRIAHGAYGDTTGIMVDLGHPRYEDFDRARLPVRYYRVDFSHAERLAMDTPPRHSLFIQDVKDCASMFLPLMQEVRYPS
jgi:hypothetical protein